MTLNARVETVDDKPSFRDVVSQRCLVIANGFYEWQWLDSKGKNKVKYEIGIDNEELFAFAGLYSHWTDTQTGEIKNTYTILTTEANPLMAEIHNHKKRMPIILHPEDEHRWLEQVPVQEFAFPYTVDLMARKIDTDFPPLLLF
jgi:putative SOS response-associated peptidase YedK